jgi:hypothetical protein
VLVEYMIPSTCTATTQGERVSSLTLMSKGEKGWYRSWMFFKGLVW